MDRGVACIGILNRWLILSIPLAMSLFALLPSPAAENGTTIHDGDSVPMNNWTDQSIDDRGFTLSL